MIALVLASACASAVPPGLGSVLASDIATSPAAEQSTVPRIGFDAFIDGVARALLSRSPEDVTDLGLSALLGQHDDRLNDLSHPYRLATARLAQDALREMAAIDVDTLTPDQRITFAVTEWHLDDIVTMAEHLDHEYAVDYISGAHATFPEFMADIHPVTNLAQADAYVERLRGAAIQLRQVAENLAHSEQAGNLPTETGIRIAAWQISRQLTAPAAHPLVTDLAERLTSLGLGDAERDRILGDARAAVQDEMLPAYRDLLDAVITAATRSDATPGVLHHPDEAAFYAAVLRHHTTTSLTPHQIHSIGLEQVSRLRRELSDALTEAGFDVERLGFAGAIAASRAAAGSIALRSDGDRRALLQSTQDFIADAAAAFDDLFTRTPSSPIEVQRPRPGRESGSGAYYRPPPVIGERPGVYYLSLDGEAFEMQTYATTNYHEAIPGHHLQIALQRRSSDLPLLQRSLTFTGFAEGWALYAERLAFEAGRYADDPQGNIGRLRMGLLRAARAVADTGIHALGWSRSRAVTYLTDLGFPDSQAAAEVDRYIIWPGQAPSYLIGMLEILRLRSEAASALGPDFDLAAFHDAILRHGSVPVEVLDQIVAHYIEAAS